MSKHYDVLITKKKCGQWLPLYYTVGHCSMLDLNSMIRVSEYNILYTLYSYHNILLNHGI